MRATEILRLDLINENSKSYLRDELLKLLPIVIMLLILVVVSSVSVSAIATRRRLKDYAKYYVLGLQWKQCAVVNLLQALITGAAALAISIAALFIVSLTPLSQTITIIFNAGLVLSLLGILALYLVFSMIMPLLMLRSTTPKALLQAEQGGNYDRNFKRYKNLQSQEKQRVHGAEKRLARNRGRGNGGGQQQRAAIARAMINSPEVLLCDEPTGNP